VPIQLQITCHSFDANAAWLEIILAATDLVAWTQLLGFTGHPDLARCEIQTFRYRVLHVAAQITRGARQIRLRIDTTWRWANAISQGWQQLRSAFS
jgi:Transposase DDE domain group 1